MIEPVAHRVVIKQDKVREVNETYLRAKSIGIEIPETDDNKRAQASVDTGIVVAFGPSVFKDFNVKNPLSVGSRVAYARFSGKAIVDPEDNEEYILLNDEDVVCILK